MLLEYYSHTGIYLNELLNGRWSWSEDLQNDCFEIKFKDLFGHENDVIFKFNVPSTAYYNFYLLSENFGLIRNDQTDDEKHLICVRLNWDSLSCTLGDARFHLREGFIPNILVDSTGLLPNNDINFLCYVPGDLSEIRLCNFESAQLSVTACGSSFSLPIDKFNCMDLKRAIVSGLSTNLQEITRYNIESGMYLDVINVTGLPASIRCLRNSEDYYSDELSRNLDATGAWTNDYLYIWSEEDLENDFKRSTIYSVRLNTGIATPLNYVFDNWIRRLVLGPGNDYLYVRNDQMVPLTNVPGIDKTDWVETFLLNTEVPSCKRYRYFLIPLVPESLFVLSARALPQPWHYKATHIIAHHEEFPKYFV